VWKNVICLWDIRKSSLVNIEEKYYFRAEQFLPHLVVSLEGSSMFQLVI